MRESDITLFEWNRLMALEDAGPIANMPSHDAVLSAALALAQSAPQWQARFFREFTAGRFIDAAGEEDGAGPDAEANGLMFPILYRLNYDALDLRAYAYCIARLANKETGAEQQWAALVLEMAMAHYEGCVDTAVAHLRRAIELEPNNMGYMAKLLDIHGRVGEDVLSWYDVAELTRRLREIIGRDFGVSLEHLEATELNPNHPLSSIKNALRHRLVADDSPERLAALHAAAAVEGDRPMEGSVRQILASTIWAGDSSVPDSIMQFMCLLLRVQYAEADELSRSMDESTVWSLLDAFSCEEPDIRSYAFWAFRLIKHETARDHYNASQQIRRCLYRVKGAPETSLFHARRAMALAPDELEYKRHVLAYYGDVSEHVLSRLEAMRLAKEALAADPEDRETRAMLRGLQDSEARSKD